MEFDKRTYWNELLQGALVMGLLFVLIILISYLYGKPIEGFLLKSVIFVLQILILGFVFMRYGRRVAPLYAGHPRGFTYGNAFAFSMILSLFAGLLTGLVDVVMHHFVDPEFYRNLMETATQAQIDKMPTPPTAQQLEMMHKMQDSMSSPLALILMNGFGMMFSGGLVALVTSALLKKPASALPTTLPEE